MKKDYITPAAEKVEFDYTETVVASNYGDTIATNPPGSGSWECFCNNTWHAGSWGDNCVNGVTNP